MGRNSLVEKAQSRSSRVPLSVGLVKKSNHILGISVRLPSAPLPPNYFPACVHELDCLATLLVILRAIQDSVFACTSYHQSPLLPLASFCKMSSLLSKVLKGDFWCLIPKPIRSFILQREREKQAQKEDPFFADLWPQIDYYRDMQKLNGAMQYDVSAEML